MKTLPHIATGEIVRMTNHDAIPLHRYGSAPAVGEMIVFLCSNKASYITGQSIAVDGGFQSTGVGLPSLREKA